nr:MAG TPA: hypothetical protein [Caudoviricetes sp.]
MGKPNPKNTPRGIFEDRRDDIGGDIFDTLPLCLVNINRT